MVRRNKRNIDDACRRYSLTIQEACLAVLIASDVAEETAFMAVFNGVPSASAKRFWQKYASEHPLIKDYINEIRQERAVYDSDGGENMDLRTKEGVINALTREAKSTTDPKQRASIIGQIADLQRMKNEEDKEKHKLVHYYLPLRCDVCPWKQKSVKED